jgi:ATP-dependent Lon protease
MSMSYTVARAIAEWIKDCDATRIDEASQQPVRPITPRHTLVIDHFHRRYGSRGVGLFSIGMGVPLAMAQSEAIRALEILDLPPADYEDAKNVLDMLSRRIRVKIQAEREAALAAEPEQEGEAEIPHLPLLTLPIDVPEDGVLWQLCNASVAAQNKDDNSKGAERTRMLEQLATQPQRWLPVTADKHIDAVKFLLQDFPNFKPAIDAMVRHLSLLRRTGAALRLPPMLLLGPPGVGKTEFARRIAEMLGLHLEIRSLGEMTASWLLTGSTAKWSDATPGVIARVIVNCHPGEAPMLLLDELDKARSDGRSYPCDSALLGVLESSTAKRFRDENLDLELDASPVSYLLTANRRDWIRPELLSRLKVVEIPLPTPAQVPAIVRSIDRTLRREDPDLASCFAPLDAELIEALSAQPPRELRRLLLELYGLVSEQNEGSVQRLQIRKSDLERISGTAPVPESAEPNAGGYVMPLWVDPRSKRVH